MDIQSSLNLDNNVFFEYNSFNIGDDMHLKKCNILKPDFSFKKILERISKINIFSYIST